jgi:hypothetical protein
VNAGAGYGLNYRSSLPFANASGRTETSASEEAFKPRYSRPVAATDVMGMGVFTNRQKRGIQSGQYSLRGRIAIGVFDRLAGPEEIYATGGLFKKEFDLPEIEDYPIFGILSLNSSRHDTDSKLPFHTLIDYDENEFWGWLKPKIVDFKTDVPAICSDEVITDIGDAVSIEELLDDIRVRKVIYRKSGNIMPETRKGLLKILKGKWKIKRGDVLKSKWYIDRFQRGLIFLGYTTTGKGNQLIDHDFGMGTNLGWGTFIYDNNKDLLLDNGGNRVTIGPNNSEFKKLWFMIYKEAFEIFISKIFYLAWEMEEDEFLNQLKELDKKTV